MNKTYVTLKSQSIKEAEREINEYAKLGWIVKSFFFNQKQELYITLMEIDSDKSSNKPQSINDGGINVNTNNFGFYGNYY